MIAREITSTQHPIVKRLVKLRESRSFREEEGGVLVVGVKLVTELSQRFKIKNLITVEPSSLPAENAYQVTPEILKKITALASPDGLAAEFTLPKSQDLHGAKKLLVLDTLSDPGNLGTLLRTALALGWDGAFLLPHTTDPFNEKALRAAKGASFLLPLRQGTLSELEELVEERAVFVASVRGAPLSPTPIEGKVALILGSEAHGVQNTLSSLGKEVSIPMNPAMESLNVASAGAILMHELNTRLTL